MNLRFLHILGSNSRKTEGGLSWKNYSKSTVFHNDFGLIFIGGFKL